MEYATAEMIIDNVTTINRALTELGKAVKVEAQHLPSGYTEVTANGSWMWTDTDENILSYLEGMLDMVRIVRYGKV